MHIYCSVLQNVAKKLGNKGNIYIRNILHKLPYQLSYFIFISNKRFINLYIYIIDRLRTLRIIKWYTFAVFTRNADNTVSHI